MTFIRIPTELSSKERYDIDGYPTDVPVRTADLSIDVLDDRSLRVGVAGQPAAGALFSFAYQPVLVACSEGFVPEAGSVLVAVYLQDNPFYRGRAEFEWNGRGYRIEYRDYDDFEHYMVLVGERIPNEERRTLFIVAKLHELSFLLKHELEERNYEMRLVKVA